MGRTYVPRGDGWMRVLSSPDEAWLATQSWKQTEFLPQLTFMGHKGGDSFSIIDVIRASDGVSMLRLEMNAEDYGSYGGPFVWIDNRTLLWQKSDREQIGFALVRLP